MSAISEERKVIENEMQLLRMLYSRDMALLLVMEKVEEVEKELKTFKKQEEK